MLPAFTNKYQMSGYAQRTASTEDPTNPPSSDGMGEAWDVANTSLWLASDESKYVTAAEIVVDGGVSARFG